MFAGEEGKSVSNLAYSGEHLTLKVGRPKVTSHPVVQLARPVPGYGRRLRQYRTCRQSWIYWNLDGSVAYTTLDLSPF